VTRRPDAPPARVRGAARWRAALVGTAAALGTPASLGGARLERLLKPNRADGEPNAGELALALGVAGIAIRSLARLVGWLPAPVRPWRDSCLYRSAAQCAVLRRYGRVAHLALGARRISHGDVGAHAWVVYDGPELVERPVADFVAFRPSTPR
jgi:Transglutaminase-like superfamily